MNGFLVGVTGLSRELKNDPLDRFLRAAARRSVQILGTLTTKKLSTPGHGMDSSLVGVTGFEPTAFWTRTRRATNCATPRTHTKRKNRSSKNAAAILVGDDGIEPPQVESESTALPLCKSPIKAPRATNALNSE